MLVTLMFWVLYFVLACLGLLTVILTIVRWFAGFPNKCENKTQLAGKTVIVTGANSGIGLEAAKEFACRGARVIMACRNKERAMPAVQEVKDACGHENVEYEELDLASYQSIFSFAGRMQRKEPKIHILVNNAGLNLGKRLNPQGIDVTFAVNHLGPFLLTHLLLDTLKASAPARIVNVSSLMHFYRHAKTGIRFDKVDGKYKYLQGYDISKLANILHANELGRRLEGTGVTTYSLHPGAVATSIWNTLEDLLPAPIAKIVRFVCMSSMLSPKDGAQTTIYCAVDESLEGVTGKYYDNCMETQPSKHALDEELAMHLWEVSMELTGLVKKE